MVLKSAGTDEGTITGHGPCIVVAALNFIEGIPFPGMVTVVYHAGKHHRLFHQTFCHHVCSDLVFKSAHALMKITKLPGHIFAIRLCFIGRIGIHHHAALAGQRIGSASFPVADIGSYIGGEIVFPQRFERG